MSIADELEQLETHVKSIWKTVYEQGADYLQSKYHGFDWYQLTDAEMEVFQLALEDMPKLIAVHELYYDATKITSQISAERVQRIRQELDWLSECLITIEEWQRFAKLFGVSFRQSAAFYHKYTFWDIRQGHTTYKDESGSK